VREIDVTELQQRLSTDPPSPVVDVRETWEFSTGHVPGARNVPLSEFVDRVHEVTTLPGDVLLICESGARSAQVTAWLAQQGHAAVNVAGGTGEWRACGLPVEHPVL
jgi:rhodanese-related sulfurtransferase